MIIPDYNLQFSSAVAALRIQGINSYYWCGIRFPILPRGLRTSLTAVDIRSCLASAVEGKLYSNFYCSGTIQAGVETIHSASSEARSLRFVERLSAANHGADHFDPGWCVVSLSNRSVCVIKDGLRLVAPISDCVSEDSIVEGITISLRTSKECFGMTPGFYLVIGSAAGAVRGSAETLVRLYWNVTSEGAIALTGALTNFLNNEGVVFRFKTLRDPFGYRRCDAAVLYLSKDDLMSKWDGLVAIYSHVRPHMKIHIPAMTKRLADGWGLAEDPSSNTSFGLHRCGIIGEGLIRAWEARIVGLPRRLAFVAERLSDNGISLSRPYLNPGSKDDYPSIDSDAQNTPVRSFEERKGADPLEAALTIGHLLVNDAIYSKNHCTWLGYRTVHPLPNQVRTSTFGTIGPCLYDGNAGIAWFLAELYSMTKDDAIGQCAEAALNGALVATKSLTSSFFTGWMGVALSLAYASHHLSSSYLRMAAIELLNRLDGQLPLPEGSDLLSGSAGLISGLLLLATLLQQDALVTTAAAYGYRLLESAEKSTETAGCSWSTNAKQLHPNLTGLSHGASGIALALFQLSEATGLSEFRDCAHQGVLYERFLFDPTEQNWPDLRVRARGSALSTRKRHCLSSWCHGAPGIGVSRMAAWRVTNEVGYLEEARAAFRSTLVWTEHALEQNQDLGCLCHGVVGNALILMSAQNDSTLDDAGSYRMLTQNVGSQIASRVLDGKPLNQDELTLGDNPSLMLGLSGAGHYLLRAAPMPPEMTFLSPVLLEDTRGGICASARCV